MQINNKTITLRELIPDKGMVITDVATETMRAKIVSLGVDDKIENYKEIDENTPLPEFEQMTDNTNTESEE